jgi:hypothetical protein
MELQINDSVNSVLKTEVSLFRDYHTRTINLLDFLTKKAHLKELRLIRAEPEKKIRDLMKARISAITPSGVFTARKNIHLVKHTGLMQFDIDFKENKHIKNYDALMVQLSNIPNVAYVAHSASYTGYWGLIKIAWSHKHLQHFRALQNCFTQLGLTIDPSCSDVSRLRGYSWDDNAYFNHNPLPFYLLEEQKEYQ